MPTRRRQRAITYCEGVNQDGQDCVNNARVGRTTCRWHDPEVLALRIEAEAARLRVLKAAGVA